MASDFLAPGERRVTAVLGPTNTGKTHYAVERMLAHRTGVIGLPLRLLAREVYDRIVAMIPPQLHDRLEPAEIFHEILEHRWLLSERAGCEQDIFEVAADYFRTQLAHRPAEVSTQSLPRTPPR